MPLICHTANLRPSTPPNHIPLSFETSVVNQKRKVILSDSKAAIVYNPITTEKIIKILVVTKPAFNKGITTKCRIIEDMFIRHRTQA